MAIKPNLKPPPNTNHSDINSYIFPLDSVMDWSTLKDDRSGKWTRVTDNTYQQLVRLRETLRADGSQIRELVHDSIVVDSTVVQCLSPLGIIKEWEENPEHHVMEQSELVDCLSEIDFDDFKVDLKNVKLDGITVDEDKSPQSVREYNSLLSRLDMRRLGLIERQLDSNGYAYIWGQKGRGSKKYKQLVIYHRNMFMVMRGKFQLKEN